VEFRQAKIVVDETLVRREDEEATGDDDHRSRFNPEQHIMLTDAQRMKKDAQLDEENFIPLETREDFGRIAAQAAKQVIMQKVREAERAIYHRRIRRARRPDSHRSRAALWSAAIFL